MLPLSTIYVGKSEEILKVLRCQHMTFALSNSFEERGIQSVSSVWSISKTRGELLADRIERQFSGKSTAIINWVKRRLKLLFAGTKVNIFENNKFLL